jgi:hypothetical protein
MGYTHYLYIKGNELDAEAFSRAVNDFKFLIPKMRHLGIKLADANGKGSPYLTNDTIRFNGLENCGHEKHSYGLVWPMQNARGVAISSRQKNEVISGTWFAGLTVNARVCNGDCSHEPFEVNRVFPQSQEAFEMATIMNLDSDIHFTFCKTNYKPYDFAVCVACIILKHYFPNNIKVHSDGTMEQWIDAVDFVKYFLKYDENFELDGDDF